MKTMVAAIVERSVSGVRMRVGMVCCLVVGGAVGVYFFLDATVVDKAPRGGMPLAGAYDPNIPNSEGELPRRTFETPSSKERRPAEKRISIISFETADFEAAWNEAVRSGKSEVDRLYNLSLVVGQMGRIAEPNQVLEKIINEFGPGRSRCHLVSTLFMSAGRPDQLAIAYEKLEYPDEQSAACSGISHNLCMLDSPDLIDRSKYAFLGDRFDEVLQKSLELYVSRFQSGSADELSAAVIQALDTQTSMDDKQNLISRLIRIAPFDCWEQVTVNKLNISGSDQKALFSLMFAKDATVAMERIAAVQGGEKYFSSAFKEWLRNDAREPIEWLENHKQTLSPVQKDRAMQGIAEYSAHQGDFDVARGWINNIEDMAVRKNVDGQIWTAERGALRKEVGMDPSGTVQSIVSGQSKYEDYWLEEAMTTWVAKDFDNAQGWYEQNWKTLPANKAQYVAAAFATQAVKQGNTAAARQWSAFIQNPKTKQRIEAGIAKAEGQ